MITKVIIPVKRNSTLALVLKTGIIITLGIRGPVSRIQGRSSVNQHLTVTKHEPHNVQGRISTMYLADDLITHFLVTSI